MISNMFKRYGLIGSIRLLISLIYTKIFFKKSRLIRLPFDIRNKHLIDLGEGLTTGFGCRIEAFPLDGNENICVKIGNNVQLNDYVHIGSVGSITIGNNVLIASKVYISDHNHGGYDNIKSDSPLISPFDRKQIVKPVFIEDNVWIGESVCILPGVRIGYGSVIGALSVVSKDIPPYCIAVGSPAKVIKIYDFNEEHWITNHKI